MTSAAFRSVDRGCIELVEDFRRLFCCVERVSVRVLDSGHLLAPRCCVVDRPDLPDDDANRLPIQVEHLENGVRGNEVHDFGSPPVKLSRSMLAVLTFARCSSVRLNPGSSIT